MKIHYVCETCGQENSRRYAAHKIPSHFFCSVACQNVWQKTRKDIVEKNKDPHFRKKVSEGLKARKKRLGSDYHSKETKKKIGEATSLRWNEYSDEQRDRMIQVLRNNAIKKRTYGPYDYEWNKLSAAIKQGQVCRRCGTKENLNVHHIIPVSANGSRDLDNLVTLCSSCHRTVEHEGKKVNEIIGDWQIARLLIKERLMCLI